MSPSADENLVTAGKILVRARHVIVFTGSGMSRESGIPTFRGREGLWNGVRPEDVATPEAFAEDPKRVWTWYRQRILAHTKARPNPGHIALADMERYFHTFAISTQNVDGLHEDAGSTRVHHVHGSMRMVRCESCGHRQETDLAVLDRLPPPCPQCDGLLRPDIVWFGEMLPEEPWLASLEAARNADVCLAVGSSHLVQPAALIPLAAKEAGAQIVEVNPEPSQLTPAADVHLAGPSGDVLPRLLDRLAAARPPVA